MIVTVVVVMDNQTEIAISVPLAIHVVASETTVYGGRTREANDLTTGPTQPSLIIEFGPLSKDREGCDSGHQQRQRHLERERHIERRRQRHK